MGRANRQRQRELARMSPEERRAETEGTGKLVTSPLIAGGALVVLCIAPWWVSVLMVLVAVVVLVSAAVNRSTVDRLQQIRDEGTAERARLHEAWLREQRQRPLL